MKLTNTRIKSLTPPTDKAQSFHWDSETRGFGLRITAAGAKSWIVQGRVAGKTRRFTLAPFELLSAEEARKRAQAKLLEMYDGKDPQAEKRQQAAQGQTLREVMEEYVVNKKTKNGPLRPSSVRDIRSCVEKTFEDWADKPVTTINHKACEKRFRELSKKAPAHANLAFRNLRALLNWARVKSLSEDGVYTVLPVNPVSHMDWNPEKRRDTSIPHNKIGAVWLVLEEASNPDANIATTCTSADLVAFMLLTGARVGEARQLTWDRVKLDADCPTFHFEVTKNHKPLTLPISDALKTVLDRRLAARKNNAEYVFPAVRGNNGYMGDPRAMFVRLSEEVGEHVHPHALRRTFDGIAQLVGVDSDQRRLLLNHISGDVHSRHYSNNATPTVLLPAVQRVGNWITEQATLATPVDEDLHLDKI